MCSMKRLPGTRWMMSRNLYSIEQSREEVLVSVLRVSGHLMFLLERADMLFSGTALLLHARVALDLLRYPKVTRPFVILWAAILRTGRRAGGWLPETR